MRGGGAVWIPVCLALSVFFCLTGCQVIPKETEGRKELDYTILEEEDVPEELRDVIEAKKKEPFQSTLEEGGRLYIARGYGEQPTDGYTIQVTQCAAAGGAVYVHTVLTGPGYGQEIREEPSWPYLVIETGQSGKYVVFE